MADLTCYINNLEITVMKMFIVDVLHAPSLLQIRETTLSYCEGIQIQYVAQNFKISTWAVLAT